MAFERILLACSCIVILLILALGIRFQKKHTEKTGRRFILIICTTILYILINLLTDIFDGKAYLTVLNYILNLLLFVIADLLVIAFIGYLHAFLKEKGATTSKAFLIPIIMIMVRQTITIILLAFGNVFSIENGKYVEKSFSYIPYIFSALTMIELIVLIIYYRKYFNKRELTSILIYELLPIGPIIGEMFTSYYSLTEIAITISDILIFTFIQDNTIKESSKREKLLKEISSKDLLTGLFNRREYDSTIKTIDADSYVGVVFCDINGLKYTNDPFGHAAGDELIIKFSKLLTSVFDKEQCFRISGDEFVVLYNSDQEIFFNQQVKELKAKIEENNNICAIGSSYGLGNCASILIKEAEQQMYEDKKLYGRR